MNIRHLFGKPLPRALLRAKNATGLSLLSTIALLAGAGVVTWLMMALLRKEQSEMEEEMIYFWPE